MKPINIRLTAEEVNKCNQAATLRWQLARASGVVNQRKDGSRDDGDIDLLGIKAEVAVANLLDCKYSPFEFGVDTGTDFFLGKVSIDVKSTFYKTGKLLFKSKDYFKADCSVLVSSTNDDNVMSVVGYSSQKYFLENCVPENLGHGQCVTLKQDQLKPMENLWRYHVANKFK